MDSVRFDDCELDLAAFELRRAGKPFAVEPQVFELLSYLARHPGRLISKDELIEQVWGGRIVSDAALASRIKSARRAIGDDGEQQRLIRTVHGRGFRFLGASAPLAAPAPAPADTAPPATAPAPGGGRTCVQAVGRSGELEALRAMLTRALEQRRQTVFVTGEAGLGKTTLIDTFVRAAEGEFGCRVAYGQCLQHRGISEAYMPALEALGRLCRRPDGAPVIEMLRTRAPSWLLQMPWLVDAAGQDQLRQRSAVNAREPMLREIVEAIEMTTAEKPLLLVLEDLHWSDPSTIDLIARLAQRHEPARLMIIGSYRPTEAGGDHPLPGALRELRLRNLCSELALPLLDEAAVTQYVAGRFPRAELPADVAHALYRRTEGNPLFMSNIVDAWIGGRMLVELDGRYNLEAPPEGLLVGMPDNLRRLIELNLERLSLGERGMLEAASVIGREFAAAAVAAGAECSEEDVDLTMLALARPGGFLREAGVAEWSDGIVTSLYVFQHDLYREVLYDSIPARRRLELHRRVAVRLEVAYGSQAARHAAELALHFSRGRKATRTIRFAQLAAEQDLRRGGVREALAHIGEGLAALPRIEEEEERRRLEFGLQITRATAAITADGYGADTTEQAYRRARELSPGVVDPRHFQALYGLFVVRSSRGRLSEAAELAREMVAEADDAGDAAARCVAHWCVAIAANFRGDFARAHTHALQAVALHDPQRDAGSAAEYAQDIGVGALAHKALAEWHLGHHADSQASIGSAVVAARATGHANTIAYALLFAAYLRLLARQAAEASRLAEELVHVADERCMGYWAAAGRCVLGAAAVIRGDFARGRDQLQEGLERLRATQIRVFRPAFLAFLAEAKAGLGQTAAAAQLRDEALATMGETGERWFDIGNGGRPPPAALRHPRAAAG